MPSVANDKVKKKLFSFEALLKNQKFDYKLNEKKKNDNSKMFMALTNSFKLKGLNAKTLKSNYLFIRINKNERKNNFIILRQYGETNKKILLECYKDNSLKKLKSIIDLDNVEQVDFNEKSCTIFLSKSVNENCSIDAVNKELAIEWLSIICKHCGFSEIKSISEDLKIINVNNSNLSKENNTISIQNEDTTLNNYLRNKTEKNIIQSVTLTNKKIAGVAAYSVGSFDLCNRQLENFFEKNKNEINEYAKMNSLVDNKEDVSMLKDSYIDLKECLSGLDDSESFKQLTIKKNRSFDSLDENTPLIIQYNDNYSVFDLDIGLQQKYSSSNDLKATNRANIDNKVIISPGIIYQQSENHKMIKSLADVSHGYYNTTKNVPNNDYINYTETFDSVYQNFDYDLNYVPLVVVEKKSPTSYTSEYNKKYLKETKSSNQTSKKLNSKDLFYMGKISSGYTAWDAERTQALKHTQTEFKRPI